MEYLGFIIGYAIILFTPAFGLWHKIFPRLDRPGWIAFVPIYNYYVALRACKQPWYWVIFLLLPGIQFMMWAIINVTFIRKFGEYGVKETILGILFPFPVFWKIANNPEEYGVAKPTNWDSVIQVDKRTPSDHVALFFALPILGHIIVYPLSKAGFKRKPGKKSMIKEWGDAILFAMIAASAIRTYVFEPYTIPTGSMEKTLMVGDYLFVEKITYGPRIPMTPFSFPVVHNSFPYLNIRSYTEVQKIPYTRLPGIRFVERNDVTVFNFPAGDKALNDPRMPNGLIGHTYYQILNDEALLIAQQEGRGIDYFEAHKEEYLKRAIQHFESGEVHSRIVDRDDYLRGHTEVNGILDRPVDKRENYIKRCVAIPGDVIEVVDKELYVNNELAYQAPNMQYNYYIEGVTDMSVENRMAMKEQFNVLDADLPPYNKQADGYQLFPLNKENFAKAKKVYGDKLKNNIKPKGYYGDLLRKGMSNTYYPIFPNDPQYDWTEDNFGPLEIPYAGQVVNLNERTLPIYRRLITVYERHELEEKADGIYIDGKKVTTYTVEMNYYWMMGDNRNNSADSRAWGFVPEDHIVGHAAFIWMSKGPEGVRWERVFNGID